MTRITLNPNCNLKPWLYLSREHSYNVKQPQKITKQSQNHEVCENVWSSPIQNSREYMNIGPGLKPRTYRWSNRSLCVRCCKVSSTRSNGCLKFGDIYPLDLKRVVDMHSSHHLLLKGSKTWTKWRKDRIANVVRRESKHKYYMSMSGQHNQIVTPLILRQKYQKGSFLEFFYQNGSVLNLFTLGIYFFFR